MASSRLWGSGHGHRPRAHYQCVGGIVGGAARLGVTQHAGKLNGRRESQRTSADPHHHTVPYCVYSAKDIFLRHRIAHLCISKVDMQHPSLGVSQSDFLTRVYMLGSCVVRVDAKTAVRIPVLEEASSPVRKRACWGYFFERRARLFGPTENRQVASFLRLRWHRSP